MDIVDFEGPVDALAGIELVRDHVVQHGSVLTTVPYSAVIVTIALQGHITVRRRLNLKAHVDVRVASGQLCLSVEFIPLSVE